MAFSRRDPRRHHERHALHVTRVHFSQQGRQNTHNMPARASGASPAGVAVARRANTGITPALSSIRGCQTRTPTDGELLDIGGKLLHRLVRQINTPHVPHSWEAQTPIPDVARLHRSSLVDVGLALARSVPATGHVDPVAVGGLIQH
jgi:hypothetical protein